MQPYRRRGGNSNLSLALAQLQRQTDTELVPFHLHGAPISADAIVVDAFAVVPMLPHLSPSFIALSLCGGRQLNRAI